MPVNLPARYKPLSQGIESGGFGSVVPMEDAFLRRIVLLKEMHDPSGNSQLKNEIQGLCSARSRHVVEIYDVIYNGEDVVGVIIERLRGRSFVEFWKEAPQDVLGYLKILYQISTALGDIHAAGVVHRDLKLENFKESSAGILKIFDFGISSPSVGYETMENKGTLGYVAPEFCIPGALITREMDVYAFGVCAWKLASQKLPKVLLELPPQNSARCPSIEVAMPQLLHPDVVRAIDSCLDPSASARPSAKALSELFARHLVRGKHKGLFVHGNKEVFELSSEKTNVNIKIGNLGEISVIYDGLQFKISSVAGSVRLNNKLVGVGDILHEACLFSFGDRSLGSSQEWVTFFSSHPEVVL